MTSPMLVSFSVLFCLLYSTSLAQRACPAGTFRTPTSTCLPCPKGTFQDKRDATSCKPCPAGYFNVYSGAAGIDICQPCPSGTFSSSVGATSSATCKPCRKGTTAPEGADRCLSCPAGSFLSRCPQAFETFVDANNVCAVCNSGICERARAALKCRKCDLGSFTTAPNSLECEYCSDQRLTSLAPTKPCQTCPRGMGVRFDTTRECLPCEDFQFNDGKSAFCSSCPSGYRGNKRRSATRCEPCPSGTAGILGSCSRCADGQNAGLVGRTFCQPPNAPCASNFFRDADGGCRRCKSSERLNRKLRMCVPCEKNKLSKGGVDTKCRSCPSGERAVDLSLSSVGPPAIRERECQCKLGWAKQADGRCRKCPPGFFRDGMFRRGDESQESACLQCPNGSFSAKAGSVSCTMCRGGTAQPADGQTRCVKCPRGTVPASSHVACVDPATRCPKGETRVNRGTSNPFPSFECRSSSPKRPPCSSFERFLPRMNECTQCPSGAVSDGGTDRTCEACEGNRIIWSLLPGAQCQCVTAFFTARHIVNGKCELCPPGKIGTNGVAGCFNCPAGTEPSGGSRCRFCEPGEFSKEGDAECRKCPPGTMSYGYGFANCV